MDLVVMASTLTQLQPPREAKNAEISDEVDSTALLSALDDEDCRCLLEATTTAPMTVRELSDRCGVPNSTLYRKLELLTDAGLMAEMVRVSPAGTHASQYRRAFEDVTISLSSTGGVEVEMSPIVSRTLSE